MHNRSGRIVDHASRVLLLAVGLSLGLAMPACSTSRQNQDAQAAKPAAKGGERAGLAAPSAGAPKLRQTLPPLEWLDALERKPATNWDDLLRAMSITYGFDPPADYTTLRARALTIGWIDADFATDGEQPAALDRAADVIARAGAVQRPVGRDTALPALVAAGWIPAAAQARQNLSGAELLAAAGLVSDKRAERRGEAPNKKEAPGNSLRRRVERQQLASGFVAPLNVKGVAAGGVASAGASKTGAGSFGSGVSPGVTPVPPSESFDDPADPPVKTVAAAPAKPVVVPASTAAAPAATSAIARNRLFPKARPEPLPPLPESATTGSSDPEERQ